MNNVAIIFAGERGVEGFSGLIWARIKETKLQAQKLIREPTSFELSLSTRGAVPTLDISHYSSTNMTFDVVGSFALCQYTFRPKIVRIILYHTHAHSGPPCLDGLYQREVIKRTLPSLKARSRSTGRVAAGCRDHRRPPPTRPAGSPPAGAA